MGHIQSNKGEPGLVGEQTAGVFQHAQPRVLES